MLTEHPSAESQSGDADGAADGGGWRSPAALENAFAFIGAFALILIYALRGGSYDIVAYEEYGLVIWALLALGVAFGLLPRTRPGRPALVLCGALLAYAGWTAISLSWSQSSERTTSEITRSLDYLGLVALLACTVGRRTWRAAVAGLGSAGMAVCALAVASRLFPSAFPDNAVSAGQHFYRLSYPFGYWNAVAAWGAMCVAFGLGLSAHAERRWVRALALAFVPVAYLTTYLSYSRAGYGGVAVAVIVVLLASRNRFTALLNTLLAAGGSALAALVANGTPAIANATGTQGRGSVLAALAGAAALCAVGAAVTASIGTDRLAVPRRAARVLTAAAACVLIAAASVFGPHLVKRAWHSFKNPAVVTQTNDPTVRLLSLSGTRYLVWKSALKAFQAHPLDGTGAGTFEFWWNQHGTDPEFTIDAHSLWFQNMAELGLPGLLLIAAVVLAAIWLAIAVRREARRRVSAGAATASLAVFLVYLVHASVDWMWESTAVTVLALAVVAAAGARLGRRSDPLRWWMRLALVAFATCAAIIQLPGLLSTLEIRHSQTAERAGNASVALAWANAAVSAEPWSASAYEQRALVLEAAGRYARAARDEQRAIDHEPTNYVHYLVMARIDTERRMFAAALRSYDEAHRLRPLSVAFESGG
jgi:hypothetical protein